MRAPSRSGTTLDWWRSAVSGAGASALRARARRSREWLFDAALPFWWNKGFDRAHGGFHDLVGVDGQPVPTPKRTFVQARQVYAFLQGGLMGWPGPWREAVEAGLDVLDRRCRSGAGGFIHCLDETCQPEETRRDLYDQAFVAFAWAQVGGALGRPELVERARRLFAELDRDWRREGPGHWEGELPLQPPRRQNPHMHLVEAALAVAATPFANGLDRKRMDDYARLLPEVFLVHERDALPELFDADWRPQGGSSAITEPGHHFEWFWLLERVRAAGGVDHTEIGRRLWRFALQHGVEDRRNVAIAQVAVDGTPGSALARLWPQAERLKAALAEARLSRGSSESLAQAALAFDGLQPYLAAPASGAFFDKMRPDGSFVDEPARASSLYHLVCAYVELGQLADALG